MSVSGDSDIIKSVPGDQWGHELCLLCLLVFIGGFKGFLYVGYHSMQNYVELMREQ